MASQQGPHVGVGLRGYGVAASPTSTAHPVRDSSLACVTSSFARLAQAAPDGSELLLLDLDGGARGFELGLDFGCFVLAVVLDYRTACFGQVLGFLEPKAGDGAHFLDDLELLVTCGRDHHGELGLLFCGCCICCSRACH